MRLIRIEANITGRVQGVGFRYFTSRTAAELGLLGWVKNMKDGSVEICAEGEAEAIDDLLRWCKQGPPNSKVTAIDLKLRTPVERSEFSVFEIRRD